MCYKGYAFQLELVLLTVHKVYHLKLISHLRPLSFPLPLVSTSQETQMFQLVLEMERSTG